MLNAPELLIIAGVVVVMFGGSKLPKLGSAVGETIKNFKNSVKDDEAAKPSQITAAKDDDAKK
jgi:sec-independent protein translocase protein TatA